MSASVRVDGATAGCAEVVGELDIATAPLLQAEVTAAVADRGAVVIDLSAVSFVDSSGLRALINLCRQYDGRVSIGPCSTAVERVVQMTGMSQVLGLE